MTFLPVWDEDEYTWDKKDNVRESIGI